MQQAYAQSCDHSKCPYLCTSLAAVPIDRQSSTIAVTIASGTRNLGLRTVCVICLYGGILALAAFQEYPPLPATICGSIFRLAKPCGCLSTSSSPRAWLMRIDELLARMSPVFLRWRWVWRGGDGDGGVSSVVVVARCANRATVEPRW